MAITVLMVITVLAVLMDLVYSIRALLKEPCTCTNRIVNLYTALQDMQRTEMIQR